MSSAKHFTEVLIGGKVYTLSGFEGEEYLQKVSSYLNHKISECTNSEGYRKQSADTRNVLLALNIADDYFKAKKQGDSRFYRSGQRAEPAGDEFCRTISILSPFYSFLFCHIFCSDLKIRNRRRENYKSCQIR